MSEGLYAVAWTTLSQGLILILGVVIMAPNIIMAAGGFTNINEVLTAVNPTNVDPWVTGAGAIFTPEYIFSFSLLLMIGLACEPHVINNILSVKYAKPSNVHHLLRLGFMPSLCSCSSLQDLRVLFWSTKVL